MATEIRVLDNKYFLLKVDDINKLDFKSQVTLGNIARKVELIRKSEGKKENDYVVLNLDDAFDFQEIIGKHKHERFLRVKDIAVDLVNAILKAKGD